MPAAPKPVLRTVSKDGKRVGRPKNTDVRVREHLSRARSRCLRRQQRNEHATGIVTRSRYGMSGMWKWSHGLFARACFHTASTRSRNSKLGE
jgi:hypothetical protein